MSNAAIAQHLNIQPSAIKSVEAWVSVLFVRFVQGAPRFVSKKVLENRMEIKDKFGRVVQVTADGKKGKLFMGCKLSPLGHVLINVRGQGYKALTSLSACESVGLDVKKIAEENDWAARPELFFRLGVPDASGKLFQDFAQNCEILKELAADRAKWDAVKAEFNPQLPGFIKKYGTASRAYEDEGNAYAYDVLLNWELNGKAFAAARGLAFD